MFLRSGVEARIKKIKDARSLCPRGPRMLGARSGRCGRNLDIIIIDSDSRIDDETKIDRIARLFYTQIRALTFSHSFYLRQVDAQLISGQSSLEPSIK